MQQRKQRSHKLIFEAIKKYKQIFFVYQHLLVHIHPERVLIVSVRDIFFATKTAALSLGQRKKVQKNAQLGKRTGAPGVF